MVRDPELAAWLIAERRAIEAALLPRLAGAPLPVRSPEAEALRRFRSFAAAALLRGDARPPALDGVRADRARVAALLEAWCEAACARAGPRAERVRAALAPLATRFHTALRGTAPERRRHGAPRAGRRAVRAAIDRVADAFLAVDADTGCIADANPAAGALLGVARDALIGRPVLSFVPGDLHEGWWTQLGAAAEGGDSSSFRTALCDARGGRVPVDARATRYATRGRTLALILARPER